MITAILNQCFHANTTTKVNLHHAEKAVKPLIDAFEALAEESV